MYSLFLLHYSFHMGRAFCSKCNFIVYTLNKQLMFPNKYRERHKVLLFVFQTVLITLVPDSSFYVLKTSMKEQLQKQKCSTAKPLPYSRDRLRLTNGVAPFSRVIRMRKRLLVLMRGRGPRVQKFKVQRWLRQAFSCHFTKGAKKKEKKINDHFHRLQWGSWSDNCALQWACSVMRAGINTWHISAGVCLTVGQQSHSN